MASNSLVISSLGSAASIDARAIRRVAFASISRSNSCRRSIRPWAAAISASYSSTSDMGSLLGGVVSPMVGKGWEAVTRYACIRVRSPRLTGSVSAHPMNALEGRGAVEWPKVVAKFLNLASDDTRIGSHVAVRHAGTYPIFNQLQDRLCQQAMLEGGERQQEGLRCFPQKTIALFWSSGDYGSYSGYVLIAPCAPLSGVEFAEQCIKLCFVVIEHVSEFVGDGSGGSDVTIETHGTPHIPAAVMAILCDLPADVTRRGVA
jgi:hypothetical protein